LRREGVVSTRREGKQIYYSLHHAAAAMVLETLYGLYCGRACHPTSIEEPV
jgi:ArsR family transcriptional regulator